MFKYNGWTNYETWNVNLWLSNDEETYHFLRDLTNQAVDQYELSTQIKEWVEDQNPLHDQVHMFSDLLSRTLRQVDYIQIAEKLWEEREEDED